MTDGGPELLAQAQTRQAEDLHGHAKLKGAQAIVGEGHHAVR
jgi:hypothetical protein